MRKTTAIFSGLFLVSFLGFVGIVGYALTVSPLYGCNVQGLTLYGDLITTQAASIAGGGGYVPTETIADDILSGIRTGEEDENIKAIVLEIDSNGGLPVAGEEVANALKRASKPTVAFVRSSGLSASYWAATGADIIFASKNSDVGSIGIILSLMNEAEKNKKDGVEYTTLKSTTYKDIGDPSRPLTEEEKELLKKDIDAIHNNFVDAISENRKLPREEVALLADGRSFLGSVALEKKLIDRIGDQYDVEAYLKEIVGEEVEICWPSSEEAW